MERYGGRYAPVTLPAVAEGATGRRKRLSVEALLRWAYDVERVDSVVMTGFADGMSATARAAKAGEVGTSIPGGHVSWYGVMDAAADARAVHRLVLAIGELDPAGSDRLLIEAAKRNIRPGSEVALGGPKLRKADPCHGYDPAWRKGKEVWICRLELVPDRERALAHRALYHRWREALLLLWRQLRVRPWLLAGYEVDDDLPPPLPPLPRCWQEEQRAFLVVDWREAHGRWQETRRAGTTAADKKALV